MGKKSRGMGHAIKQYQFAQAAIAQSRGNASIGLPSGYQVAAPLSIDMMIGEYERRFDRRYAYAIRDLIHELARERAARTGTVSKKAFREVYDALLNRFKLGEHGTIYLLAVARTMNVRPASLEEALDFVSGFMTRTGMEGLPEKERFHAVWKAWDSFLRLFHTHVPCVGMGNLKPDTLLRSLDLWMNTDMSVAPCHAMRVMHVAARVGFDAEIITALALEHGAERLDDLARLVEDGTIDSENVWELQTRPDLMRALTFGQIDWLMREWRANPSADLLAFARDRRRTLRHLRGPLFVGTRPSPMLIGEVARAIETVYRETTAEERASSDHLRVLRMHETTCGKSSCTPGAYVPSDDAILGSTFECPPELSTGLGRRLSLTGEALEERAEQAIQLFGDNAPADRVLFALDLLCEWDGTAAPGLCLRAANAAKRARIPDSFAFDLLAQFGRDHAAEAVGLIEDGLVGLKECQRLLKYPSLITEHRGTMRRLLERYREAGSPADLCAIAYRRGSRALKSARATPATKIVLRGDTAIDAAVRYLAALDAAEAQPAAAPTTDAEPKPAQREEPVTERPHIDEAEPTVVEPAPELAVEAEHEAAVDAPSITAKSAPYVMPDDSPILRVMREVGDELAATAVKRSWEYVMGTVRSPDRATVIPTIETIIARMVRAESREQPKKKVTRESCYNRVMAGTFLPDYRIDDAALSILVNFERAGLSFQTHGEFLAFYHGISERIGHTVGATFETEALDVISLLLLQLKQHMPHLPPEHLAALNRPDTLLTGIDLFAWGDGAVPICKCLRIAVGLRQRMLGRTEAFWLWRTFTPARADDLVAFVENRRVPTRGFERVFQHPETVTQRSLNELVTLLAA